MKEPQAGFALGVGLGGLAGRAMLAFTVAEPQFQPVLGCKWSRAVPVKLAAQLSDVLAILVRVPFEVLVKHSALTLPAVTVNV